MLHLYEQYNQSLQKIADVKYASAVLQWDQETYIPAKGGEIRGRQIATLSEIAHEQFTSERFGNLLQELLLKDGFSAAEKRNVELSWYDYNKSKKLPSDFVRRMSEAVNKSFYAWIQARKENNFAVFQQPLHEIIEFKKQEADLLGYEKHPYDALMNDYDRGLNTATTDVLFASLKPRLLELLEKIKNSPQVADDIATLHLKYGLCNDTSTRSIVYNVKDDFTTFNEIDKELRLATAITMFGLKLKQSKFFPEVDWPTILNIATASADRTDYLQNEFIGLIEKAQKIYPDKKKKKGK